MKKFWLLPLLILSLVLGTSLSYADDDEDVDLLENDFRIEVEGDINLNSTAGTESGSVTNFNDSNVTLSVEYKDKIRAVITAQLEKFFQEKKLKAVDNFKLGEFIKEAYIEIREINGSPIALVIGKHQIAFGQNVEAMPNMDNNPNRNLQKIDEVMGITVDLTEGLFGIFDQVEVSVFETEAGDMKFGKMDGASIRLSKLITDSWLLTLSHAELGEERRTSVGLIGESEDGKLVGWVEATFFDGNEEYENSKVAITVGGMVKVHETTDLIVEYNYVDEEVSQIGVGVRTALTENLTLGAEVRYNNYVEQKDDVTVGVNLTYHFGTTGIPQNDVYLFGDKDE